MKTNKTRHLIIGAGPAGLAVAGRMRSAGIPFEIVEASNQVGSSWHGHYDRLCLHTVKEYSNLPGMEIPQTYPRYVPRESLIEYFKSYAKKFEIIPHFKTKVESISKSGDIWLVQSDSGTIEADRVIIATGANRVPNMPTWPDMENYTGQVTHSRIYKNPKPYEGLKTLVIGFGNTGAEIALDLADQGIDTTVSIRSPVNIVPRDLNGRPVQVTGKKLEKLPWGLGDRIGTIVRKIYFGNLGKYGIPVSKLSPAVQLRKTGKTPVIDLGTVNQIKSGKIKVIGDVQSFYPEGVITSDGQEVKVDAVILATGYRPMLGDFLSGINDFLDQNGFPKSPIGSGQFAGLYFVGFDNYKLGGILGTIHSDSARVVDDISGDSD